MGSTLPPHKQVLGNVRYESRTPLGLDGIGNEVRFPGPCILVKRCRSDTGRLPRGSPHRGVHLEDRRTYLKGGWERFWRYRLGGDLMEYHDGDTELLLDFVDLVPQHNTWVTHWQRHWDRLP